MWADTMIIGYEEGREELKWLKDDLNISDADSLDRKHINSMISDMSYVIEWLKKGREPGKLRGIDKNSVYQINSVSDLDMFPSLEIQPKERELTEEEKRMVYDALRELSPRERQAFICREAYLWSYKDIAQELGVSISTVQSYLDRAKNKLSCRKKAVTA